MTFSRVYGLAQQSLINTEINLTSASLKAMLCTSSYAVNQDTHRYLSDVTNEVVGTGYTAGGKAVTNKQVTYNASTNTVMLDIDDVSWPGSTLTARYAVFYIDTGSAAASPLLCYWDFEKDIVTDNLPFVLMVNPAGLITLRTG